MNKKTVITFKILEVNNIRKQRTQDFIRVEVFEDDESVGWFWQSPKLIKNNIKRLGEDAYLNLLEFKSFLLNTLLFSDDKSMKTIGA